MAKAEVVKAETKSVATAAPAEYPANAEAGLRFLGAAEQAFRDAAERAGLVEKSYRIGGHLVRLRFAGEAMLPLIAPALEHLNVPPAAEAELTVCVWDSESTGVGLPQAPWNPGDDAARAQIVVRNWDGVEVALFTGSGQLNTLDRRRGFGLHYVPSATLCPPTGSPLLTIMHWWTRAHGLHLIHAGAVGFEHGGALLVGRGGSGKSTAALSCLNSRLGYLGDDYCLVSGGAEPYAHSLYNSGKLLPSQLAKLPFLASLSANHAQPGSEKEIVFVHRHFPEKLLPGFPVRTILVPRIVDGVARAVQISPAEALKALAPSTLLQLKGADRYDLEAMAALVRAAPCYRLEVNRDLAAIPALIEELLA